MFACRFSPAPVPESSGAMIGAIRIRKRRESRGGCPPRSLRSEGAMPPGGVSGILDAVWCGGQGDSLRYPRHGAQRSLRQCRGREGPFMANSLPWCFTLFLEQPHARRRHPGCPVRTSRNLGPMLQPRASSGVRFLPRYRHRRASRIRGSAAAVRMTSMKSGTNRAMI